MAEVNGEPHLKVIDFGLAKVLSNESSWSPTLTKAGVPLGSPLWMSPEQTRGRRGKEDVDTRTDIYSLGVILYELLTNTTPITKDEFARSTPTEILAAIQEEDPPYPSRRIAETNDTNAWLREQAAATYSNWANKLSNDLDWITMKALEKDRDRRYATVNTLADDVRRFLDNEPVFARPPSFAYRARKLGRKYQFAAIMVGLVTTLLLVTAVVSTLLAVWALNERRMARLEKTRADQVMEIVRGQLYNLNPSNPGVVHEDVQGFLLETLSDEVSLAGFMRNPETEAGLRCVLGRSFSGTGNPERAIEEFKQVIAINGGRFGVDDDLTILAQTLLAFEYLNINRYDLAKSIAEGCVEASTKKNGKDHELTLGARIALCSAKLRLGEMKGLVKEAQDVVQSCESNLSSFHSHIIESNSVLADIFHQSHRYKDAIVHFDRARIKANEIWGADYRRTMELEVLYWEACARDFKFVRTKGEIVQFTDSLSEKFGETHPVTMKLRDDCAGILLQQGFDQSAYQLYSRNYESFQTNLGENNVKTAQALERMAFASGELREFERAVNQQSQANAIYETVEGSKSVNFVWGSLSLGNFLYYNDEFETARLLANELRPIARQYSGEGQELLLGFLDLEARCCIELGQSERGLDILKDGLAKSSLPGQPPIRKCQWLKRIAQANWVLGNHDEVLEHFEQAYSICRRNYGLRHLETQLISSWLLNSLLFERKFEEAERLARRSLAMMDKTIPIYEKHSLVHRVGLAEAWVEMGKTEKARSAIDKVLESTYRGVEANRQFARANSLLAVCKMHDKEFEESSELLQHSLTVLKDELLKDHLKWYRVRCLERLVRLYESWDKPAKAKEFQQMLEAS